jgi:hypothetical protein
MPKLNAVIEGARIVIDQIMVDWGSPIDGARDKIREALVLAGVAE